MVGKFDKFRMRSTNVSELGGTKFRKIGLHLFISAVLLKKTIVPSLHVHQIVVSDLSCLFVLDQQSLPVVGIVGDSASGQDECFHGTCSGLCLFAVEVAGTAEVDVVVGIAVGDAAESLDRPMDVIVARSVEKFHFPVEEP